MHEAPWPPASIAASWNAIQMLSTLSPGAAELEASAGADPKARHLPFRCARMLESVVHAFASHMACMKRPGHPQVSRRAGIMLARSQMLLSTAPTCGQIILHAPTSERIIKKKWPSSTL
jgi:hypothetical protein